MRPSPIRLYLIPGSGADGRMFAAQRERFAQAMTPEWLPPTHRKEPLEEYARRLAKKIDTSTPFVIGGVSLGGMVALEMARHTQPLAVILIASSRSSQALPTPHRLTGKFMRALPNPVIKGLFRFSAFIAKKAIPDRVRNKPLYVSMLKEMPPSLVRWQSGAATEWFPKTLPPVPIYHIHGEHDPILPPNRVKADRYIKGGHLINMTQAGTVNDFIDECLNKAAAFQSHEAVGARLMELQ